MQADKYNKTQVAKGGAIYRTKASTFAIEKIAKELLVREEMIQDEFDAFFEWVDGVPEKISM